MCQLTIGLRWAGGLELRCTLRGVVSFVRSHVSNSGRQRTRRSVRQKSQINAALRADETRPRGDAGDGSASTSVAAAASKVLVACVMHVDGTHSGCSTATRRRSHVIFRMVSPPRVVVASAVVGVPSRSWPLCWIKEGASYGGLESKSGMVDQVARTAGPTMSAVPRRRASTFSRHPPAAAPPWWPAFLDRASPAR